MIASFFQDPNGTNVSNIDIPEFEYYEPINWIIREFLIYAVLVSQVILFPVSHSISALNPSVLILVLWICCLHRDPLQVVESADVFHVWYLPPSGCLDFLRRAIWCVWDSWHHHPCFCTIFINGGRLYLPCQRDLGERKK